MATHLARWPRRATVPSPAGWSELHLHHTTQRPGALARAGRIGAWPEVADDHLAQQPVLVDRLLPLRLQAVVGDGHARALHAAEQRFERQQPLRAHQPVGAEVTGPIEVARALGD